MAEVLTADLVADLRRQLEAKGAPWLAEVTPGLQRSELENGMASIGLALPEELETWFSQWDGVPLDRAHGAPGRMFGPFEFLPFSEALDMHRDLLGLAEGAGTVEPMITYFRDWFPILSAGQVTVRCECVTKSETCAVRGVHLQDVDPKLSAASLGDAVRIWITALDTRAWRYDADTPGSSSDLDRLPTELRKSRIV